MDSEHDDASSLLQGISQDVERQIQDMEKETASYARSRKEAAETQAREIQRKAQEAADVQGAILTKNAESKAAIERRKMALRVRDRIIQETLDQARKAISERIGQPGYERVLKDWIVEAAVGLSVPIATVNASREELPLITEALLREAEKETKEITGKNVRLSKVDTDPLPAQGVVLTAEGGHLAYNNQVPTRFLRAQTEIRKRIHAVLFNEGI